jgi:hypothetical protein
MTNSRSQRSIRQLHKSSSGHLLVSETEANKVAKHLASYVPSSVDAELWNAGLGDFVRTQLSRIDLTMSAVNHLVWTLSIHGAFCVSEGIALDVESVLDPDAVERFCAWAATHYSASTASTMRSRLRSLGPLLTKKAPWEPKPQPVSRKALTAPYSASEIEVILRDAGAQTTAARNRAATAIALLGLGAGLDARWTAKIHGIDVRRDGKHVVVDVPDPAARIVVVRSRFANQLFNVAQRAGEEPLFNAKASRGKNVVSNLCPKIAIDRGRVHLSAARLRSSWIVAHLSAGTPMPVLIEAAGTKGFGSFDDLLPFVERQTELVERNALAGA